MAQKDLTLRIKTVEKELNNTLKKIGKLETLVNKLSKAQIKLRADKAKKEIKAVVTEAQKGEAIVAKLFNPFRTDGFGRSIGKVRDQLSQVRAAFDAANSAADRQKRATALIAGNFKKIRMEAVAFAMASGDKKALNPGATGGNVKARLKEIEAFPKTILAGREAMGLLNRMLELAEVNSQDFLDINKAIGKQLKQNADIQRAADKAAGLDTVKKKTKAKKDEEKTDREINRRIQKRIQIEKDLNRVREKRKRQQELEIRNQKRAADQAKRTKSKRRQSQLLGAGFPLLFGGGPGAVGGSLLGSFFAPEGEEFGGQIFGSAIGTVLERTLQRVNQIGNAVQNLNLNNLEQSGIRVNAELETTIKRLKQAGEFEQAEKVLLDQVNKQTGAFGNVVPDIANNINILVSVFDEFLAAAGVTLGIIFTPIITGLAAIIKLVNITLQGFNRLVSLIFTGLKIAVEELIKLFPGGEQALERINKLIEGTNKGADELTVRFNEFLDGLKEEEETIREKILLGEQEAAIQEKIRDAVAEYGKDKKEQIESAVRALAKAEEELKQAEKIRALFKSIGQTIEDGLVDAIDGAINKTKTLGDVARSVFRQIQRSLIQFGVNSFLGGIFRGGIPGLGSSRNVASQTLVNPVTGGLKTTDILPSLGVQAGDRLAGSRSAGRRADGGPVRRGGAFIVGERGPELFTPGVSGMITPNHALGGSTSVVVNVDASGSSVEGDEQRGRELGLAISAAVQSELIQQKRPGGLLA